MTKQGSTMSFQHYQICKVAVLTAQSLYPKLSICQTNVRYKLNRTIKHLVKKKNPERGGGARFSAPVQTGPGAHPAFCTMCTGSFSRVKSGRGVTLTPHPLLVPWSWKSGAMSLLPLWAVRPVQSLSACTRVHFTLWQLTVIPHAMKLSSVIYALVGIAASYSPDSILQAVS
jgi:hypothetical protein